ncbi:pilus assembly protein PilM [Candidatus Kaiserbacteria bacterium]|nr:pilus assembly protein PilM [Candidatus Kaiserbacteria bacterium]
MKLSDTAVPPKKKHPFASMIERAFPPPASLDMQAVGVDISDASIRWVVLEGERRHARVRHFGELPLDPGIVEQGMVRDVPALAKILREIKGRLGGVAAAHAALPEENAYVFSMHVPEKQSREEVLRMIEFEFADRVPILPASAVYDFDVVTEHDGDEGSEIAISVFPKEAAEKYVAAFSQAGFVLLSLEVEACSIARVITTDTKDDFVTLLVDFGRTRTGFAVLKHGVPIFTSTVEIGGEGATQALAKELGLSAQELEKFKDEEGLRAKPGSLGLQALSGTASAFADEVARHYHYWDTRRDKQTDRATHVSRVVLVGGGANLKGLTDYIARRVHARTDRGEIWGNVCQFEEYIPPIDYRTALQYATAVGLALRAI